MKTKCDKCYIEVEERAWSICSGILFTIILQIMLMIPIINLWLVKSFCEAKQQNFWEDIFYTISTKQIKVKYKK